jgi:DNA-binding transcriptional regulator YhcF (GntR family)
MSANVNKIEARKTKVLEEKLKSPQKTIRELAKDTDSSIGTVARDLKKLAQDGTIQVDETMNAIKDADLEIVTRGQKIILQRFRDEKELKKISARDVSVITKDSQVRYSFLAGENAKTDGGEKEGLYALVANISRDL